ncbi:MAG: T9SS type A sorting domain-containing protein [Flavobacteriales bacterium]|nr:T9SS type A sorting domain-containing protein [Flavobacteriales bacterium]
MIDQPLVEVKSTQRCPAVVPRTTYLIGSPVPGSASICGALSYTYEFQQYSDCSGTSVGMPFTVNTPTNTPYLSLISAFPTPTYPMAANGTWRVRIRPNFVYGNGNYGPYQMVIVSSTAAASALAPDDGMIEGEKSLSATVQARVFPNPNDGNDMYLMIETPFEGDVQIRILDAVGRETEKRTVHVDQILQFNYVFNRSLESGVYFVELSFGEQIITEKFIVNQ